MTHPNNKLKVYKEKNSFFTSSGLFPSNNKEFEIFQQFTEDNPKGEDSWFGH